MEKQNERLSVTSNAPRDVIDAPSTWLSLAKLCPHRAQLRFTTHKQRTGRTSVQQELFQTIIEHHRHVSKNPTYPVVNKRNFKMILKSAIDQS